jgi:peptide/nickel transport system ATP-binding protein
VNNRMINLITSPLNSNCQISDCNISDRQDINCKTGDYKTVEYKAGEFPLLSIEKLHVSFWTSRGLVKANENINLEIKKGEILGLVGETGCGKTTFGKALMRLLSKKAKIEGKIIFMGRNLLTLSEREMRKIRGKEIGIMLQNPSASLNPVFPVGKQIAEIYSCHEGCGKKEAKKKAEKMLELVGLDPCRGDEYPHQFSGGMLQRVMVAIGLALKPALLIADEPTKGLDPETKSKIADLIFELVRKEKSSLLLITHDLEFAGKAADRLAVMYAGELVETGRAKTVISNPKHPYTQALLCSLPKNGFRTVSGQTPSLVNPPAGCRYHPRCSLRMEACAQFSPEFQSCAEDHQVRCFLSGKASEPGGETW